VSRQAHKLEALLARIQRNRQMPRAVARMSQPEPKRSRSPSPLEIAVEEFGAPTPPHGSSPPLAVAQAPQRTTPAQRPEMVPTPAMFPAQHGVRQATRPEPPAGPPIAELRSDYQAQPAGAVAIESRGMGPPSEAIVRSTGVLPVTRVLTFGELITKTLALRP
jgi:hypothetical protein